MHHVRDVVPSSTVTPHVRHPVVAVRHIAYLDAERFVMDSAVSNKTQRIVEIFGVNKISVDTHHVGNVRIRVIPLRTGHRTDTVFDWGTCVVRVVHCPQYI